MRDRSLSLGSTEVDTPPPNFIKFGKILTT